MTDWPLEEIYFRILEFYTKYAKFCTIQKFPAIRYVSKLSVFTQNLLELRLLSTNFQTELILHKFDININN